MMIGTKDEENEVWIEDDVREMVSEINEEE